MQPEPEKSSLSVRSAVQAADQSPLFKPGDLVRILSRSPLGHYRVPTYMRGKIGMVEAVIMPMAIDNEDEGFGRNAGSRRHYYRIGFMMSAIWSDYTGASQDGLRIEVFETWLERIET